MKILWLSPFFLHPTDRGAQIRTLGTLKELHKRHEIHFAALNAPENTEGPKRSGEYSSRHFQVEHVAPSRKSFGIVPQLANSLLSPVPMAVFRYDSAALRHKVSELIATEHYDSIVCDFLASAPNLADLSQSVLFQHNVETTIWQRHVEQADSALKRIFFRMQASKMEAYERKICRAVKHVIAVSEIDAARMRSAFEIETVSSVRTGTDVEYFAPPDNPAHRSDLVFCGSMDWLPNVDAVQYFLSEILPLIRKRIPDATFTVAGRSPDPKLVKAVEGLEGVVLTGRVDDMRPYLWGSKVSIVPIRIGGGTRLKIYECMAAGVPVVSTTIGAEGLRYAGGKDILIADEPEKFADACIRLLSDAPFRRSVAAEALDRAQRELSWAAVSREFEAILEANKIQ